MALYIVSKSDLETRLDFMHEADCLCRSKTERGNYVAFEPMPGCLVLFGALLTENKIPYKLELGSTISPTQTVKKNTNDLV